jgi:hypothetical protein
MVKSCMFPDDKRTYVIIAHAQEMERTWLEKVGLITPGPPRREILDTQAIERHIRNKSKMYGALSDVCDKLGIDYRYLHNAGNDAAYELVCFLRLACLAGPNYEEYRAGYIKDQATPIAWVEESGQGSSGKKREVK